MGSQNRRITLFLPFSGLIQQTTRVILLSTHYVGFAVKTTTKHPLSGAMK